MTKLLSSATLAAWRAGARHAPPPSDQQPQAISAAKTVWHALQSAGASVSVPVGVEVPDVAYALVALVRDDIGADSQTMLDAYELLSCVEWPVNEFTEKQDVLADIAYRISVRFRQLNNYAKMRVWEEKCISLLRDTEPSRTYLENRQAKGGNRTDAQFLSRPAVLLAVCRQLEKDRNYRCCEARAQAGSAFEASRSLAIADEELNYLRGDLALSMAISTCHLGALDESSRWLSVARDLFDETSYPSALMVGVDTAALIKGHAEHRWQYVVENIGAVLSAADRLGMSRQAASLRLLRAHVLKECCRFEEALEYFHEFEERPPTDDPMMLAVNLVGKAETQHALGDSEGAAESCCKASVLAERSNAPLSWGMLHSSIAQILRDSGRVAEAIRAFDRAIDAYASGGLAQLEAYMMLLSAEFLLGIGKSEEGMRRLLRALAIFRVTKIDAEIAVAIELLRAAIRSGLASSPQALRELGLIIAKFER